MVRSGIKRKASEVVFRVPKQLTRIDIASYLDGLYGVKVSAVRTFNFLSRVTRNGRRVIPSRKNAIVTLAKDQVPFQYPSVPDAQRLRYPLPNPNQHRRVHSIHPGSVRM